MPNVTWMRESRPLPRLSGKYVYLDEGGLYTLLVMDSTARDGGKYVCRACNLYGVADTEKAVRVVSPQDYTDRRGVKPAIIVSRPNDRLNVAVGEDITVTLRVAGEPKPKGILITGALARSEHPFRYSCITYYIGIVLCGLETRYFPQQLNKHINLST